MTNRDITLGVLIVKSVVTLMGLKIKQMSINESLGNIK